MKKLFDYLIEYGGEIVSSNDLSSEDINQARASDRMFVDESGYGFIWEPKIEKLPETDKEVMLFERWYPLQAELPYELRNLDWLFKKANGGIS